MDPILAPFLKAATSAETNEACFELFEKVVDPALRNFGAKWGASAVHRKGGKSADQLDMEDLFSETRLRLINKLYDLKADTAPGEIKSIKAYTYSVAESVRAEILRKRNPNRSALSLKVRYLLEGGTNQRGFALWPSDDGELVAGYRSWEGRPADTGSRFQALFANPGELMERALKDVPSGPHLAEMVAAAFDWMGAPIRFHALVSILANWTNTRDEVISLQESDADDLTFDPPDPAAGPDEQVIWLEYLEILWRAIQETTLKWRIAFLLKADVTHEFVYYCVASRSGIARALEMPVADLARLWPDIPLDDLAIAAQLKLQRQQVINLRSIARRAFHEKTRLILDPHLSKKSR